MTGSEQRPPDAGTGSTSTTTTAAPTGGEPSRGPAAPIYPTGALHLGPPGSAPPPQRHGWDAVRARWRAARSRLLAWWYSPAVHEVRAAWHDTRRAPGIVVAGLLLVCWIAADFTVIPVLVAVAAWFVLQLVTMPLRYRRWRWRRRLRPLVGLAAMLWLIGEAGPWAWLLGAGLWLIAAALTETWRARRRILAWVLLGVAHTTRVDPETLRAARAEWDGRRLVHVEVTHRAELRSDDPSVRERVTRSVGWRLRHAGAYRVTWPPGMQMFEISAEPPLPGLVYDQLWPPGLPGIPVGVTDVESADGEYEVVDSNTGEVLARLPLVLDDPTDRDRHKLVVGGTGGGKTTFIRGYIARGLKLGWFPGGVFILDGKGSGDYIVFEDREGVHCVARDSEAWENALQRIEAMMRGRYEEEADYERGLREKPDHPRYLVVLEEAQQIRAELTPKIMDAFTQQMSRQMRASNGLLMVSTQRADVEDAVPGAVRDMLEDRYVWGFTSPDGARMALGQDWRAAVDEYGAEPIAGRGVARVGGRLRRLQGFALDSPRRVPQAEAFYPPKVGEAGSASVPVHQNLAGVADLSAWSPRRRRPEEAAEQPAQAPADGTAGQAPNGRQEPAGGPGGAAAAPRGPEGPGGDPEAQGDPFRRRRTI